MRKERRNAIMRALPVLLLAAVVGFLLGARAPSAPPSVSVAVRGEASDVSPVVLEYATPGWSNASETIAIPGLTLAHEIALSPREHGAGTGLIAGRAAEDDPGPLPAELLARLREPPRAEVVSLLDAQAYRYRGLAPAGLKLELTLYAVPDGKGAGTTLVCYAQRSPGVNDQLGRCEGLVSTLTLALNSGQTSLELTPEPQYAHLVSDVVASVDKERVALRAALHRSASTASVSQLAAGLARTFADASSLLSVLQPPLAAGRAQAALADALVSTHEAYLELARTAEAGDQAGFGTARARVYAAEARFAIALGGYALLGYT